MAKKLFVPERMAKAPEAPKSDIPPAINQAFEDDEADSKNNEDPSKMEASALEPSAPASWLSSACDPVLHEGQDHWGHHYSG